MFITMNLNSTLSAHTFCLSLEKLFRHICDAFIKRNIKEIPSQCILPCWSRHKHTCMKICYDDA